MAKRTRAPALAPARAPARAPAWRHLPAGTDATSTLVALSACALSGLAWVFASADFDIWPLAYVGLVPLLWVIHEAPTRRRALFYGWFSGLVTNAVGFYWIISLLTRHASLPWPLGVLALLLLAGYQALVFLLFVAALRRVRQVSAERLGRPLPMVLLAPVIMVTFETVVPFIFPWYLAVSQVPVTPVIQIADITGPVGVTAVLMAVNGAIYDAMTEPGWRRRLWCGLGGAGFLALVMSYGLVRMHQIDARRQAAPMVKVGLVQSNLALEPAYGRPPDVVLADLQAVSADLERQGAELLVWPEGSFPYPIPRDASADFPETSVARVRRGFSAPLVLGALTYEPGATGEDWSPYNSAILLDQRGAFRDRYDKIHLLMFGEYIPGVETFPFIRDLLPSAASHFSRGDRIKTFAFELGGQSYRLGPMICYEDILPAFGRELGAQHPHLLVNITNDTWFGDSTEPWQHLALSVFRAVELRADLVRSVNTGVSALVDATGRVRATSNVIDPVVTPIGAEGMVVEAALMESGHTFYRRFGDVFGYACVLLVALLWLVWPRRRRR
jgi:apolipoprotein N-acyltransferase